MAYDVLVVDDDPTILHVVRKMLEMEAFRVKTASSVGQAVSIAEQEPPLLVVSDVLMPGATGIDLINEYRKRPDLAKIPVIIMTSSGDSSMVERALIAGAFACLLKPFGKSQLVDMARQAIKDNS